MLVDMIEDIKKFDEFTSEFDLLNSNIMGKRLHSFRVMNLSNMIAKSLNLSKDKIQIATLIGLLHDIARFEQYTKYKTFKDKLSFDHGNYAVQILDKHLREYIKSKEYDRIIKISIKNHNKIKIEDGLNENEIMFCKIIRDADKLDILNEATLIFWNKEDMREEIKNTTIFKDVKSEFYLHKLIDRRNKRGLPGVNGVISYLAFVYDINFKKSFEIIEGKKYINQIIDRFEYKDRKVRSDMEEIKDELNKYINNKLK